MTSIAAGPLSQTPILGGGEFSRSSSKHSSEISFFWRDWPFQAGFIVAILGPLGCMSVLISTPIPDDLGLRFCWHSAISNRAILLHLEVAAVAIL